MTNKKVTLESAISWLQAVGDYPETLKYCRHARHLLASDPQGTPQPEPERDSILAALAKAYRELNAIRARDGVPYTRDGWKSDVQEEYFSSVVDECRDVLRSAGQL